MNGSQKLAIFLGVCGAVSLYLAVFLFIQAVRLVGTKFTEPLPPRGEILRLLETEAKKQGVYWRVWCTAFYESDKKKYAGIATRGAPFKIYKEEGATDFWAVNGFASSEEAAYALLQSLKGPPNTKPYHREPRIDCKDETITGEP